MLVELPIGEVTALEDLRPHPVRDALRRALAGPAPMDALLGIRAAELNTSWTPRPGR